MTGKAQFSLDTPIIKTTSAIIVLTPEEAAHEESQPCIKCGRCLGVCPVRLQPLLLSAYALKDMFEMTQEYDVEECIQCGACSFICPSRRPLTESIRHAQREIYLKRKKSKK
jgi:electron transport complex protein RnfC